MADLLDSTERNFYERTRGKLVLSIVLAGVGLAALAFCAAYAGLSDSARISADQNGINKDTEGSYTSLSSGYGFASFVFILAFLIFTCGAVYASPICCGSAREGEILRSSRRKDDVPVAQMAPA